MGGLSAQAGRVLLQGKRVSRLTNTLISECLERLLVDLIIRTEVLSLQL